MRIRGIGRVRSAQRCVASRIQARALILLYHRIAEPGVDPHELCVTPEHFSAQLAALRRQYSIISLKELCQGLATGAVPRRAVALTFDDGYVDNLVYAKPRLERFNAPATIFVTTGYLGQERLFWWDELERLMFSPSSLPQCIQLSLKNRQHQWVLGQAAQSGECASRLQPWRMGSEECPTPRHGAFRDLYGLLQPLDEDTREVALAQLRRQAGGTLPGDRACRAMTAQEVCQLSEGGLVEVGAHTVTHPVLSACSSATQRAEIQASKQCLEAILGRPVTAFSYPYGGVTAVGSEALRLVHELGFEAACTTVHTPVTRAVDRYALPRFVIGNWDGDEFTRRLGTFFAS